MTQEFNPIDPGTDTLIAVVDLATERTGRRPSPSTIWRWVRKGVNGVVLEAVKDGKSWRTTRAAWARFINGQTIATLKRKETQEPASGRSEETEQRLRAAGLIKKKRK